MAARPEIIISSALGGPVERRVIGELESSGNRTIGEESQAVGCHDKLIPESRVSSGLPQMCAARKKRLRVPTLKAEFR